MHVLLLNYELLIFSSHFLRIIFFTGGLVVLTAVWEEDMDSQACMVVWVGLWATVVVVVVVEVMEDMVSRVLVATVVACRVDAVVMAAVEVVV